MKLIAGSVTMLLICLLVGFMAGAGRDSVTAQPPGLGATFDDESDRASPSPLAADPKPFWIVYYKLEAGGKEYVCRHSNKTVHQFPTENEAAVYARYQVKQKVWYSGRWAKIGN